MGDLTKNIDRKEIVCKCGECGTDTIDFKTVEIVQQACDHFAKELGIEQVILKINSGCRCEEWNKGQGKPKSLHLVGRAIDHRIVGIPTKQLYDYYNSRFPDRYGIGLYTSFVHFDTRNGPGKRW